MNCERVNELWDEYRDGSLIGPDARGLEQHLADCPACEKLWRRESGWMNILGEKTPIVDDRPGAFTAAVVKRWSRAGEPTVLARIVRITAAAALVALMLTAAGLMVDRGRTPEQVAVVRPAKQVDSVEALFASINGPTTRMRQAFNPSSWLDTDQAADTVASFLDLAAPPEPQE